MNNVYLCAKRTINTDFVSNENTGYCLEISLSLKDQKINHNEVSVYVYSSELYFAGKECTTYNGDDEIPLTVCSKWQWTDGLYHVYIYCDGKSKWFGQFNLGDGDATASCRLKSISRYPQKKFFADNMATAEWWKKLRPARFKEKLIRELIGRMKNFTCQISKKEIERIPPMLVTGSKIAASAFASMILGGFASGDDVTCKYSFSLSELISSRCGWKSQESMMIGRKVVIIEIPQIEYNHYVIDMINMLASIIRRNTYNCTFILHGTEENICIMKARCKLMNDLFDTNTTFELTTDRSIVLPEADADDEFMRLLDEFISSEGFSSADNEETDDDEQPENSVSDNDEQYSHNSCPAEDALKEMIGLNRLKKDLEEARAMAMFTQKRKDFALCMDEESRNHMLFLGNPGTGKTTVAKLIGQIYHSMGLLSSGHTVETNRSKLIGEYIGQTEKQVVETIEQARGGVLFIDEAYNLITSENDKKDFGKEVINALLTVLSEPNPDMIVIFAGYEDKMDKLMKVNPGLKDRFPLSFHFDDYTETELMEIARRSLNKMNYTLTPKAEAKLIETINKAVKNKDEFFGNGRWVHNLIKHGIIKSMAMRVMTTTDNKVFDEKLLSTIEECDITEAENNFLNIKAAKVFSPRPIGFRA